jgi:hypothetical protein
MFEIAQSPAKVNVSLRSILRSSINYLLNKDGRKTVVPVFLIVRCVVVQRYEFLIQGET